MIQALRRRHRRIITGLAVVLPLAFSAGLVMRRPQPVMPAIPSPLLPSAPAFTKILLEKNDLWRGLEIRTRVYVDHDPPRRVLVELQPQNEIVSPDLLVYWHEGESSSENHPPENSYLLGALAGKRPGRFVLPEAALLRDGQLILYSLGHQQILAATPLPTFTLLPPGRVR
jgi:hypothetical protein